MHVCADLREKREAQAVALLSITLPIKSHSTNATISSTRQLRATRPRSWLFEPITEEPTNLELLPHFAGSQSLEELKRHHRNRKPLPRNHSAPQLVSTTTTSPVHINNPASMYALLSASLRFIYPLIAPQ